MDTKIVESFPAGIQVKGRTKLLITSFENQKRINDLEDGTVIYHPQELHVVEIHNEHARDNTDYTVYVMSDANGDYYYTSSNSFFESVRDIMEAMQEEPEDYDIQVKKLPSKNYKDGAILKAVIL